MRKYAPISEKITKTFEEKFEVIGNSIDFNIPIKDEIFSPKIPHGTSVNDWRYKQPVEYVINPPDQSALDVIDEDMLVEKQEGLAEKHDNSSVVQNKNKVGVMELGSIMTTRSDYT